MHIMRGQLRVGQRDIQGTHFTGRHGVAGLDGRFARKGGGESLVPLGITGCAVAGECGERFTQAAFGVEARVRHGDGMNEERMPAESIHLKPQRFKHGAMRLEGLGFTGAKVQRHREEQPL